MNLNALDHVKRNKKMYLSLEGDLGEELSENLVDDAKTLGVENISAKKIGEWFVVYSEKDWLEIEPENKTAAELFSSLVALAGGGVNALRREVLINAFAENVFIQKGEKRDVLKGKIIPKHELEILLKDIPSEARVVAFSI